MEPRERPGFPAAFSFAYCRTFFSASSSSANLSRQRRVAELGGLRHRAAGDSWDLLPVAPVPRTPRVVSNRDDFNLCRKHPVNQIEWKVEEDEAPARKSGERISLGSLRDSFYGVVDIVDETFGSAHATRHVPINRSDELPVRGRVKPNGLHLAARRVLLALPPTEWSRLRRLQSDGHDARSLRPTRLRRLRPAQPRDFRGASPPVRRARSLTAPRLREIVPKRLVP
jgi:hypothetical protein